MKISIIFPCRNEYESVGMCVKNAFETLKQNHLNGEVIVSDSSSDGSAEEAEKYGANVVRHNKEGYGLAITEGIRASSGDIIVYLDADGTYDVRELPKFLKLLESSDIVIGSRFKGHIEKGAMPFSHKIFGTPFINFLLFIFFGIRVSDSQSGYRAFTKKTFKELNLKTNGMEFATEMIIKAKHLHLKITEVPITYSVRRGTSKLRRYHDGITHLRYIFLQIPFFWYAATGSILFIIGITSLILPLISPNFPHFLSYATVRLFFPIIGFEIFFLGIFTKTFLWIKFQEKNNFAAKFHSIFKFKTSIIIGLFLILLPIILRFTGLAQQLFDLLFVSTIFGFLLIINLFILSVINTNQSPPLSN